MKSDPAVQPSVRAALRIVLKPLHGEFL